MARRGEAPAFVAHKKVGFSLDLIFFPAPNIYFSPESLVRYKHETTELNPVARIPATRSIVPPPNDPLATCDTTKSIHRIVATILKPKNVFFFPKPYRHHPLLWRVCARP